jgi:hypothetical protein
MKRAHSQGVKPFRRQAERVLRRATGSDHKASLIVKQDYVDGQASVVHQFTPDPLVEDMFDGLWVATELYRKPPGELLGQESLKTFAIGVAGRSRKLRSCTRRNGNQRTQERTLVSPKVPEDASVFDARLNHLQVTTDTTTALPPPNPTCIAESHTLTSTTPRDAIEEQGCVRH